MKNKRLTLHNGESFVVFPLEFWEFLSNTFDELARQWPQESRNRKDWLDIKKEILNQAYSNASLESLSHDEEE